MSYVVSMTEMAERVTSEGPKNRAVQTESEEAEARHSSPPSSAGDLCSTPSTGTTTSSSTPHVQYPHQHSQPSSSNRNPQYSQPFDPSHHLHPLHQHFAKLYTLLFWNVSPRPPYQELVDIARALTTHLHEGAEGYCLAFGTPSSTLHLDQPFWAGYVRRFARRWRAEGVERAEAQKRIRRAEEKRWLEEELTKMREGRKVELERINKLVDKFMKEVEEAAAREKEDMWEQSLRVRARMREMARRRGGGVEYKLFGPDLCACG